MDKFLINPGNRAIFRQNIHMAFSDSSLWQQCVDRIAQDLPEQQFNTWIKPLQADLSEDGQKLVIWVANRFKLDWIRAQYSARFSQLLQEINGQPVSIEYVLTTKFIQAGYKISPSDVRIAEGDLSALPDDLIRSLGDAVGRQVLRPIQAGSYISLNNLKEPAVIRVGDRVRVQVIGVGFQATGEGVAQSAGSVNEIIKVRLPDGQVLQGRISAPGAVEISIE